MKSLIACALLLLPFSTQAACMATREFVTAIEFLHNDDSFKLKDPEARELAFKIAESCTGSAKRFIRIAKTLSASGAGRKDATGLALRFAAASDSETDTFIAVFGRAIAEDSLDLDYESSVKLALSLSNEFSGDQKKVREDFVKLVDFCSSDKSLGLPKSRCGAFAARIAHSGELFPQGIAPVFFDAFQYLKSDNGPALTTGDALELAETLSAQGPGGSENFKMAYQYGTSASGMNLPRNNAIQFAKKLSLLTRPRNKAELKTEGPK